MSEERWVDGLCPESPSWARDMVHEALEKTLLENKKLAEHSAHRTYQVGMLRDLLKECRKVMRAHYVFRNTAEHKNLALRIRKALKDEFDVHK